MTKRKKYAITLISHGHLAKDLHFGPFCHNWWILSPSKKINNPCFLYPIHIQSKLLVTLNEHYFIIEVGQLESELGPHPSYICKCDGIQKIIGYDLPEIVQEYVHELLFQVFNYSFNKLRIWILEVGKSNNKKLNFAGFGFKSAFIYSYNRQHSIFYQEVEFNECKITIYMEGNKVHEMFIGCDPNSVWNQVGYLKQFSDWANEHLMTLVYNYHLKRHTSTQVNWKKLLQDWVLHENTIIELQLALRNLYQKAYNYLDVNPCGDNGKCNILSVIANAFSYEEINKNLKVSNDTIIAARKYAHVCGPGGRIKNKPVITYKKMSAEKQEQIRQFLTNKENVIMSLYKTDSVTNEPVYYLKDYNNVLWERFYEEYQKGMKRTSFYAHLEGNHEYIRDNVKCHYIQLENDIKNAKLDRDVSPGILVEKTNIS
ncbi:22274_t:CDS:2 [Gigaspora rosea]|nr:22274_t:CDS:2 [Gigaspora rosea]